MLSHFTVFFVGYVLIDDLNHGWLVINVWHNAQYIVFVWMYNANRFKDGVDPGAKFLSTLSQERNAWLYFLVCFGRPSPSTHTTTSPRAWPSPAVSAMWWPKFRLRLIRPTQVSSPAIPAERASRLSVPTGIAVGVPRGGRRSG